MPPFDPYSIAPDWQAQKDTLKRMYDQGLINLNAKKGNMMAQYGFQNQGAYGSDGKPLDFSNIQVDPNQQHGLYRDELKTEADMMDAADNGPSRGFSGGLANQASNAAKFAAQGRQTRFQQQLQQGLGGLNLEAGNQSFAYGEGIRSVDDNAKEYGANQALWQATNPTGSYVVPGASGGGSVATTPSGGATPLSANAINTAASFGYQTIAKPSNLKPVTYGAPKPPARGGQATGAR